MNPRLGIQLAVLSTIAAATPAIAGAYTCNLPRALLCEDCARALTIVLTPDGGCRVSFTPGGQTSPATQSLPLRFEVLIPASRPWRKRIAWKPRPAPVSGASGGKCFSFNGNQYCE